MNCDILIRGGTLFDGSGAPGRPADVAVGQDRILAVEATRSASSRGSSHPE
jgi:N-acyl-D-aspartate/D-glutamate deacylase